MIEVLMSESIRLRESCGDREYVAVSVSVR